MLAASLYFSGPPPPLVETGLGVKLTFLIETEIGDLSQAILAEGVGGC